MRFIAAFAFLAACAAGDAGQPDILALGVRDARSPLERANAYFSLDCTIDAERWASTALQSNEQALEAHFLIAASQAAGGDYDRAQVIAKAALAGADADSPSHIRSALIGLLVANRLEAGDARGAESALLSYEPGLADAAAAPLSTSFGDMPAPPHAIQYFAITRELAGDEAAAKKLRAHFSFITPEFLAARSGGALRPADHWMLASFGAGKISAHDAAAHLEAAWSGGFRAGWLFNFGMHAAFFPFRGSKEFSQVFERIERDAAAARMSAFKYDQPEAEARGFNGMMIGARECGVAPSK